MCVWGGGWGGWLTFLRVKCGRKRNSCGVYLNQSWFNFSSFSIMDPVWQRCQFYRNVLEVFCSYAKLLAQSWYNAELYLKCCARSEFLIADEEVVSACFRQHKVCVVAVCAPRCGWLGRLKSCCGGWSESLGAIRSVMLHKKYVAISLIWIELSWIELY